MSGVLSMISDRRDPALAFPGGRGRKRRWRRSGAQVERQIHQQLAAALFGEEVDDAVKRLVGAVGVQRRQATGWPVSAKATTACSIVSRSRISPIRMTSGVLAQRVLEGDDAPAVGVDADLALGDDAVLVRVDELDRVFDRDDVAERVLVAGRSTIAGASDVLCPKPVAPTKITRPGRLVIATSFFRMCGRFMLSIVGRVCGIVRITRPTWPCCTKALTRKRPRCPAAPTAKLHSLVFSNSAASLVVVRDRARQRRRTGR